LTLIVALIALAGCAMPPVAPRPTTPDAPADTVFAVPGEKLVFRAKMRGITVGTVRTAIGDEGVFEGKRSIIARTRGETDGMIALIGNVAWECNSTIDLDRGLPVVNHEEAWLEFAGKKMHDLDRNRWHDHDAHHDAHSAVGRFRGWRSKPGDKMEFQARIAGGRFSIEAQHAGRDYIATAKAHAIRYEGLIARRFKFSAWVSDDPSRVPLRVSVESKWGTIEVDLVEYQAPR
jgi:hypothetical protein